MHRSHIQVYVLGVWLEYINTEMFHHLFKWSITVYTKPIKVVIIINAIHVQTTYHVQLYHPTIKRMLLYMYTSPTLILYLNVIPMQNQKRNIDWNKYRCNDTNKLSMQVFLLFKKKKNYKKMNISNVFIQIELKHQISVIFTNI